MLSRSLLTEDDPLGALNKEVEIQASSDEAKSSKTADRSYNFKNDFLSDQPILFRWRKSATFEDANSLNLNKAKANTIPSTNSISSSISNISSSVAAFKFNFR